MKKLLYAVIAFTLICLGCKKEVPNNADIIDLSKGLHVQVVAGNYQRDTVGNLLKDSITVKVTDNGTPVSGFNVQFKRSGCEDLTITQKAVNASGEASFAWYLSGETGDQSLKVILTDVSGNKRDSVSAAATGVEASHGWHRGGCMQNFPVNNVKALSSGRILASVNTASYPYYSDNSGVSWHPLKTFSKDYFISKIITSGNDVFLATQSQGIFYSGDNGQTWSNVSTGILNVLNFSDLAYIKNGHLIYANQSGVYVSSDKGQNWDEDDFGLPMGPSTYPCENSNGDMFIIGSDNTVYELPAHTGTWVSIGAAGGYILSSVESIYIDDKDKIFVGTPHDAPDGTGYIYHSGDGGASWILDYTQQHISSSYPNITDISQVNGIYYFSFAGIGVYQTAGFSSFTNLTTQFSNKGILTYTVAPNSTFVLGSTGLGIFYRIP